MLKNQQGFALVGIAIVIVVLVIIGLAGWVWQEKTRDRLSQQIEVPGESQEEAQEEAIEPEEEPKEPQKAEPVGEASHPSFATGQVSFTDNDDARVIILINNSMRDEPLRAVWTEYSKDKTSVRKDPSTTEKTTSHLAYNTAGGYGGFHATIPASELEPGETYFYRAAGTTRDGETIYGGVAAFNARK